MEATTLSPASGIDTEAQTVAFPTWLTKYIHEPSRIGALARDVVQDKNFPASGDLETYTNYIASYEAGAWVLRTLTEAYMAWKWNHSYSG